MNTSYNKELNDLLKISKDLVKLKELLFIQDIDGVCLPLVKNPLKRSIDKNYVESIKKLGCEFAVLTNGEHEGRRGVNRLIEKAFSDKDKVIKEGLYLPGLAAGGVQYQNSFGTIKTIGVSKKEIDFLKKVPKHLKIQLAKEIQNVIVPISEEELNKELELAILDNDFSPTINLNSLFKIHPDNIELQRKLQNISLDIMQGCLSMANSDGLNNRFYLHIAPNLGNANGKELVKYADEKDIGTTDIQFMLKGAKKEVGLMILLNKYIGRKHNFFPFGEDFNPKDSPENIKDIVEFCKEKIDGNIMPTIVGVGDTVTSSVTKEGSYQRGGSDRGFLTLIQDLGKAYCIKNKVIIVDSSEGEVYRPNLAEGNLKGISDPEDPLKFDMIITSGHKTYIEWIGEFADSRQSIHMQNQLKSY